MGSHRCLHTTCRRCRIAAVGRWRLAVPDAARVSRPAPNTFARSKPWSWPRARRTCDPSPERSRRRKSRNWPFRCPACCKLPVKEGQKVAKGEVIAELRQDEFQARLKALQGQLDQARAALRGLQAGERPEQQRRLEAQVRARRARLETPGRNTIATRLLKKGGASRNRSIDRRPPTPWPRRTTKPLRNARERDDRPEEDIEAKEAEVRGLEGRVVEATSSCGHHPARPLRRRDRPAVRRAEPEHQGQGAGRQVPGRGRDRRRRGRAGNGHGRRPPLGGHRAAASRSSAGRPGSSFRSRSKRSRRRRTRRRRPSRSASP